MFTSIYVKDSKFLIITGPSGSGRTTISDKLINKYNVKRLKTYTTRLPRNTEDHKLYNFIDTNMFKELIDARFFIEYKQINNDIFYGVSRKSIAKSLNTEYDVFLLNMDVNGAMTLKDSLKDKCITIFCNPKKWSVIENRLNEKNSDYDIRERKNKFFREFTYKDKFDFTIDTSGEWYHAINNLGIYA